MNELNIISNAIDRGFQEGLFKNRSEAATVLTALAGIEKKLLEVQKPKVDEKQKK